MAVTSIFPAIMANDVAATRDFYVRFFGFEVIFDSGWYVQLEAPNDPKTQIGVVERDHHTIPEAHRGGTPAGFLVSIEVDDVDAMHEKVKAAGLDTPLTLRSETFGQRHFMTVDPAGTLVDVITPIPAGDEYGDAGRTE